MIGELINKFEELDKQTVETFNEIFRNSKIEGYKPTDKVEIGELANTARKIIINGDTENAFWHSLMPCEQEFSIAPQGLGVCVPLRLYTKEMEFIGEFGSIKEAAYKLNITREAFNHRVYVGTYIRQEVQ